LDQFQGFLGAGVDCRFVRHVVALVHQLVQQRLLLRGRPENPLRLRCPDAGADDLQNFLRLRAVLRASQPFDGSRSAIGAVDVSAVDHLAEREAVVRAGDAEDRTLGLLDFWSTCCAVPWRVRRDWATCNRDQ